MTETKANRPKGKQTVPSLYVTAKEAYEEWKTELGKVKVIAVPRGGVAFTIADTLRERSCVA